MSKKVSQVEWLKKRSHGGSTPKEVGISKTVITFSRIAMEKLKSTYVEIGVGVVDGQTVMLVKPVRASSPNAYLLTGTKEGSDSRKLLSRALIGRILDRGVKTGQCKLDEVEDGAFAAIPHTPDHRWQGRKKEEKATTC